MNSAVLKPIIDFAIAAAKIDKKKLVLYVTAAYGVVSAAKDLLGEVLAALAL